MSTTFDSSLEEAFERTAAPVGGLNPQSGRFPTRSRAWLLTDASFGGYFATLLGKFAAAPRGVALKQIVLLICALTLLGLATSCRQKESHDCPPLPEIASAHCYRAIDTQFKIDGVLDEDSWKAAPKLTLRTSACPLAILDAYPGKVRAQWCWDDQFWYIAFTFDSPDINCPAGKKDWRSWTDDQVEVLIDPDGDRRNYCGMEIMPRQYVLDYIVRKAVAGKPIDLDANWDFKGLQIGIAVDGTVDNRADIDRRWTCEIAIPWAAFANVPGADGRAPCNGTHWRVNLLANDFLPPKGKTYIEFMWSQVYDLEEPTYQFHVPDRFGRVTFVSKSLQSKREEPGRR
jgi:hypothetical protein